MLDAAETRAKNRPKILVVDDEVALRFPIVEVLTDAGLAVAEADNADQALEILKSDDSIALVFSDIRMPGSMDGFGLAHIIDAEFAHIHILLTSGYSATNGKTSRPVIPKPYALTAVLAKILNTLDAPTRPEIDTEDPTEAL